MKKFFKNKDNIIILVVSVIAFVAGCLALNILLSFVIVGIADFCFFLPEILKLRKKKPKEKKEPKTKKASKKTKTKGERKKRKIGRIILWICIVLFALVVIGTFGFAGYIVINAPKFDPNELYAKDSTIIYNADGEEIAKIGAEKRVKIKYEALPEVLVDAIIATEDANFFQHNGFDSARFLKASMTQVLSGGSSGGGASTLTMQIVKNTYTSTESSGIKGIIRKFTDIYMAIFEVEKEYSKEDILEFYVNTYYLGSGSYGVEQASLTYFGKHAKDLNLPEAAMIAGLFQAPNAYDPYQHPDLAEKRRNTVLYLMKRHGYITDEEYKAAKAIEVEDMLNNSEVSGGNEWQAFIDTVIEEVENDTGDNPYVVPMEIYTTMDKEKQAAINDIMNGVTYDWPNEEANGGVAVVDVNTGAIVAVGAGRNKTGELTFNTATQNKRQIGSTSKPIFDYGPGIEYENWSTYTLYADEPHTYSDGTSVSNWDRGFNGLMTMRTALGQSRNIPAIKAFQANDTSNIVSFATSLGLHPEVSDGYLHEAHAIGGYGGETPLTMAAAYAAFANGGYYIEPYSYTKIVYKSKDDDKDVVETEIKKERVMSEETAYMMVNMLQTAAQMGLYGQYDLGGRVYGAKTGTSNFDAQTIDAMGYGEDAVNDLWVDGISPDYAISVWYGYVKRSNNYVSNSYTPNHRTLFQAVANHIFEWDSYWEQPEGVTEVQVEYGSWPAALPSEFTPGDMVVTELFKVGTEPDLISSRFSKLDSVSDLTGSVKDNKVTLSWTGIYPDAINPDRLAEQLAPIYNNLEGAVADRLGTNHAIFGDLVYKIYAKDKNGKLTLVKETTDTTATFAVNTTSSDTYQVVASYNIFTVNASDPVEVKVNLSNVKADLKATLKKQTEDIKVGSTYVKPTDYTKVLTVLDGKTDVTNKASVVETYTKNGAAVDSIKTDAVGTYIINYKINYSGSTLTLQKRLNVVENNSSGSNGN